MSSKTKSGPPKSIDRDYGRKPYISRPEDHYIDVMKKVTDAAMYNQAVMKQSELKKPYLEGSYEEMETYFPGPFPTFDPPSFPGAFPGPSFPFSGFDGPSFPGPGQIPDADGPWGGPHRVGCILDCPMFITHGRECDSAQDKEVCCSFNPAYEKIRKVQILAGSPAVLTKWNQEEVCFRLVTAKLDGSYQKVKILATTINSYCMAEILVKCEVDACPETASISYTTLGMQKNEAQTLTANPEISNGDLYEWAITSGGGTLSAATGNSVTYTAPSSNAYCTNNPTITLSCGGVQLDSIAIAVNAWTGTQAAYGMKVCAGESTCTDKVRFVCAWVEGYQYKCNGVKIAGIACSTEFAGCTGPGCCCDGGGDCTIFFSSLCAGRVTCLEAVANFECMVAGNPLWSGVGLNESVDLRADWLKQYGCCPEALL